MRKYPVLIFLAMIIGTVPAMWSASLESVRQLHEEGKTGEALAAIESVLGSDAPGAEKAEALDLLGTIAVDKGQLAMARQAWSRLTEEYPDFAASHDTATKLSLVSALLKADEAPPAAVTAPEPVKETVPPVAETSPPAAPAPVPEPSEPAASAAPTPEISSNVVLIAAQGKPHDAVRDVNDRVVSFLQEKGVNARSATGGIPVVEDSKMVLPLLLQKGKEEGVASVLLLTADYLSMQKMVLDCYTPDGSKMWKLKVSGGTGWKGRPYSKTGVTEALVERFMEKLEDKVGEPGLPLRQQ